MTKRLVDVDDDLLRAAQEGSGETTIKGTVHRALELLAHQNRRREDDIRARWADIGNALDDLHDPDVMGRAWSGRRRAQPG